MKEGAVKTKQELTQKQREVLTRMAEGYKLVRGKYASKFWLTDQRGLSVGVKWATVNALRLGGWMEWNNCEARLTPAGLAALQCDTRRK